MAKVKFVVEVEESLLDCTYQFYLDTLKESLEDHLVLRWYEEDFKVYVAPQEEV